MGEGKTAQRMADVLTDKLQAKYPGICVNTQNFWFQQGSYRHLTWDMASWGATVPIPNSPLKIRIHSWVTNDPAT